MKGAGTGRDRRGRRRRGGPRVRGRLRATRCACSNRRAAASRADPEAFDIRVFALSEGTRDFLRDIDAWQRMPAERIAAGHPHGDLRRRRREPPRLRAARRAARSPGSRKATACRARSSRRRASAARPIAAGVRLRSIAARAAGRRGRPRGRRPRSPRTCSWAPTARIRWVRGELGLARGREALPGDRGGRALPLREAARRAWRGSGSGPTASSRGCRCRASACRSCGRRATGWPTSLPRSTPRRWRGAFATRAAPRWATSRSTPRWRASRCASIRVPRIAVPGARPHRRCRPRRASAGGPGREPRVPGRAQPRARRSPSRSPLERPGDLALLRRHERARRADVDAMQFVTDRLEWLFGIEAMPLAGAARNAGLRAVDGAPWAKRRLRGPRNAIIPLPEPPGTSPAGRGPIPEPQRPSMRLPASLSAAFLALALALPAAAQDLDRIKTDLRKKFPEAQIDTVRKSGYGGLLEVTGGGEVFYTDEKTTFLLLGIAHRHEDARERHRGARAQALGDQVRQPAAGVGHQDRARQRLAQDRHLRGPQLRLLQALRARAGRRERHHDLHVPVPDPLAGLDGEVEGGLVRAGPCQGLAGPHAQGRGARGRRRPARRRSTRSSPSGATSASAARRRSSSRTASACRARCPWRRSRSASRTRRPAKHQ